MTKREMWLKLFSENDVALASAINFCERFSEIKLDQSKEFLERKIRELDKEIPEEQVKEIFGEEEQERE